MTALIASILAASLLGSFHCAGMCGAFVAIACGATETDRHRQWKLQAAYHLGRLTTYLALGTAAGAVGRLLDLAGALAGVKSAAAVLAATTMLLFALIAVARASGAGLPKPRVPAPWLKLMQRAHRAAMDRPPIVRAAAIGLLTTLLPCGWLYAFVVTAAGTGNPLTAALVMATFWIGTLPALAIVGASARGLLGRGGKYLSTATALAVAGVAIYVLVGRTMLDPMAIAATTEHAASKVPDPQAERACCKERNTAEVLQR
jgi:sulfite exporter TauE/SafE